MSGQARNQWKASAEYTGDPKYKMQDYDKNCVMIALSRAMSTSIFDLSKQIVDGNLGGVTNISEMENGSTIKKVLAALHFQTLSEGGLRWSAMKPLILNYGAVGATGNPPHVKYPTHKFYCVYWHNKTSEDWTDKPTRPGQSDHAFTIIIHNKTISIPPTNAPDWDRAHNPLRDDDFVSVFRRVEN